MILTIKNQVSGTRSYLGGIITVADGSSTVVPRDLNILLVADAQFLLDLGVNGTVNIILNNGVKDLNPGESLLLAQVLSQFTFEPVGTLPLYYTLPIKINQSATTSAGATVWAMRNAAVSVKQVVIERIYLMAGFDNTSPLGASTCVYEITRFNTATPTAGASITVILADNIGPATVVTDARVLDTGLTVTNMVFENPFVHIPVPEIRGGQISYVRDRMAMKLGAGEGLAIRLTTDAIVGQTLYGEIIWSER